MKRLQDELILLTTAEDIFTYVLPTNTEILQGIPETVENAYSKKIHKDSEKNVEVDSKIKEETDLGHPDIIRLGSADTGWFELPSDTNGRYNIIKKAALALAQSLNQIKQSMEYQQQKKLITVRTRCFFEYAPAKNEIIDPAIIRPPENAIKLIVRHTLRIV